MPARTSSATWADVRPMPTPRASTWATHASMRSSSSLPAANGDTTTSPCVSTICNLNRGTPIYTRGPKQITLTMSEAVHATAVVIVAIVVEVATFCTPAPTVVWSCAIQTGATAHVDAKLTTPDVAAPPVPTFTLNAESDPPATTEGDAPKPDPIAGVLPNCIRSPTEFWLLASRRTPAAGAMRLERVANVTSPPAETVTLSLVARPVTVVVPVYLSAPLTSTQ